MENKKIRQPVAAIIIAAYSILSLVTLIVNFGYYTGMNIVTNLLNCAVELFFCYVMFKKQIDKKLLLATCALCIPKLLTVFSVTGILNLLAYALVALIVATIVLPELSQYKSIAEKYYFVPVVLMVLGSVYTIIRNMISMGYFSFSVSIPLIISALIISVAILLYIKWCFDPYEKMAAADADDNSKPSENYGGESVLNYNESYCDLVKHILLSLFTFGVWMFIWIYKTTKALNKAPNSEKYDPTKKLLLCMFVPFYMIYWYYKHAEKLDKLNAAAGNKSDNTTMYLLLAIFIPVVACILMQDNINKLCTSDVNVAQASSSETTAAAVKDEKNAVEALKEYKSLLDMGIITQEEFDAKKKQLLGL